MKGIRMCAKGLAGLAVFVLAGWAAAQEAAGEWDVEMDIGGRQITAKLTITKAADGTLGGKWVGARGESVISDVKFENGKLTFKRKLDLQGQEIEMSYAGTIEGDKLTGSFSTPQGDIPANGKRAGAAPAIGGASPLAGEWDVTSESQVGTLKRTLIVKPDLTGTYASEEAKWPLRNVKVEGDQVAFSVTVSIDGQDLPLDFKGAVKGDELAGKFSMADQGEVSTVTARRRAAGVAGGAGALAGSWDITSVSQLGTLKRKLVVAADGSGTYESEEAKWPIRDLKVEGADVSFSVTVNAQGQELPLDFKGKIDGKSLKGGFFNAQLGEGQIAEVTGTKAD